MSGEYDGAGLSPESFQEIIKERKSEQKEKTELKRLDGLKRIHGMRTISQDGMNPLEIFPKVVWQLIFNELNAEDRLKMWELHQVFRGIMNISHIPSNLFPQILKFEVDPFWKDLEDKKPLIPLGHYLELRKISKGLRDGVDRFLEEDLLKSLLVDQDPKRTLLLRIHSNSRRGMGKLNKILSLDSPRPQPRLISRSITVKVCMSTTHIVENFTLKLEQFKEKITSLLKLFGKQIWHFRLEVRDLATRSVDGGDDRLPAKLQFPLNEWLSLLPNLKWMQFYLISNSRTPLGMIFDIEDLRNQKLPELKNLERMDLIPYLNSRDHQSGNDEGAICKKMLEAYPHVKILWTIGEACNVCPSFSLPNLEGLNYDTAFEFCKLQKMLSPTCTWPLKSLRLSLDLYEDSIAFVFQLVQKFTTLESLSMMISNASVGNGIDFLRLPQLREFEATFYNPKLVYKAPLHFFFSLQFLLYAKKLRRIIWKNELRGNSLLADDYKLQETFEKHKQIGNMIDFGGGLVDLNDSNIWQVFSELEYVKVNVEMNQYHNDRSRVSMNRVYRKRSTLS